MTQTIEINQMIDDLTQKIKKDKLGKQTGRNLMKEVRRTLR